MSSIIINNSFRVRSMKSLDELKESKIKILDNLTYEYIISKYPLYKQINNIKNSEMLNSINRIRSLCKNFEDKIKSCKSIEELSNLVVDESMINRLYK